MADYLPRGHNRVEGVRRLVGDVGESAVPDSLHALLAAEARDIASRLHCQPLLDRVEALAPQESPVLTAQESLARAPEDPPAVGS